MQARVGKQGSQGVSRDACAVDALRPEQCNRRANRGVRGIAGFACGVGCCQCGIAVQVDTSRYRQVEQGVVVGIVEFAHQ